MNLIYTFGYTDTETSTVSKYNDLDIFFYIFTHSFTAFVVLMYVYVYVGPQCGFARISPPLCIDRPVAAISIERPPRASHHTA